MTDVSYSAITNRYHSLPQKEENVVLRYVWLDGNGYDLRTKSSQTNVIPKSLEEVPLWTYCGKTCGHMRLTADSDCWLKPVLLCNDPFRAHNNKLVFCVPVKYEIEASVHRHSCEAAFSKLVDTNIPSFIISQPYILINASTRKPIGYTAPKSCYNYGIDINKVNGRHINEAFYKACLYAGIPINATQAGDLSSIWSYEIGPTQGIGIADQLWMTRYILSYITEEFNLVVSFQPKPVPDVQLGQDMMVCFGTNQIMQTNKTTADSIASKLKTGVFNHNTDQDLSKKIPENHSTTGKESLQEMSFASNADPYVVLESIINNLSQ